MMQENIILDYTRRAGGPKDLIQFWTPETAFMTPETFKIRIQNRSVERSQNVFSHLVSAENSANV